MMKSGRRKLAANLLLLSVSIFFSVLVAELLIRQVYPLNQGRPIHFRIPHQIFGWVLKPDAEYSYSIGESWVNVRYNSKGWRDTEHTLQTLGSSKRILILGDSFMEAYTVNLEKALPKQLELIGKKEGVDLEVINLGVGGYGTLQEYLVFQEFGQKFKSALVLLGFYIGNDVRNNSLALESMFKHGTMKVDNRPFLTLTEMSEWHISQVDFEGAQRRYQIAMEAQNFGTRLLEERSVFLRILIHKIRGLLKRLQPKKQVPIKQDKASEEEIMMARNGVNNCHEPVVYTKAWDITRTILGRLKQDVVDSGGDLLVFSVPALDEVDPVEREKAKKLLHGKLCLEDPPGYHRLSAILQDLNIEYVNLLPSFREATKNQQGGLFYRGDRHWNEQGHRVAALKLFQALRERKFPTIDSKTKTEDSLQELGHLAPALVGALAAGPSSR